jgi:DHA1 family tetracycline resistance protein-like MFS transporter
MSRDLFLVSFSLIIWGMGEGMFVIFQPIYLQQFGADPQMIGGILGGVGLMMAAAQAPAGYLADRIGGRPLMWGAWIMGIFAAGLMALGQSLGIFVAGLLLYGLTAFVSTPMNSYVADMRGKWGVGKAFALTQALYSLGAVAGPALGGWIGDQFGLRSVYLAAFVVFIVSFVVILFIRPQPESDRVQSGPILQLHRNSGFMILLPFFFLTVLGAYLPQTLTPNYLQNQQGLSLGQIGQLGSIGSLGVVAIMMALGGLSPIAGLLSGLAAISLYALILWQGTSFTWFAVAYFFSGGYRLTRTMILAYVRPVIPRGQTGSAFGLVELVNGMALFLAPVIGGWLYAIRPNSLYIASLVICGGAFMLNLIVLPGRRRVAMSRSGPGKDMENETTRA